jgi:hypothetical protein
VHAIIQTIVLTYFELGRRIVEQEQEGKDQADYGGFIIDRLSHELTNEFVKGFSDFRDNVSEI